MSFSNHSPLTPSSAAGREPTARSRRRAMHSSVIRKDTSFAKSLRNAPHFASPIADGRRRYRAISAREDSFSAQRRCGRTGSAPKTVINLLEVQPLTRLRFSLRTRRARGAQAKEEGRHPEALVDLMRRC